MSGRYTARKPKRATEEMPCHVHTDPGCDDPLHVAEVQGVVLALMLRGGVGWSGPTLMDCGCVLTVHENRSCECLLF